MSIIFGVQIFTNKNIKNNIILKTEQNSSQAHHIKRQNQNLEEKHCRFRWGGSDLQSLQNQLLFYLGLKCLITYIRFYLLILRCHYYVQVRIQRGGGGQGVMTHPGKSQVIWVSIGKKKNIILKTEQNSSQAHPFLEKVGPPLEPWKIIAIGPLPGKSWTPSGTLENHRFLWNWPLTSVK